LGLKLEILEKMYELISLSCHWSEMLQSSKASISFSIYTQRTESLTNYQVSGLAVQIFEVNLNLVWQADRSNIQ